MRAAQLAVFLAYSVAPTQGGREEALLAAANIMDEADTDFITDGAYFVFVEVYMLQGSAISSSSSSSLQVSAESGSSAEANSSTSSDAFYHSETVICPRLGMDLEDQQYLDSKVLNAGGSHVELPEEWWDTPEKSRYKCRALSYGAKNDETPCSGVNVFDQVLSDRKSGISQADLKTAYKYVYGTTNMNARQIKETVCQKSCGAKWTGENYGPINRNCNLYTRTVLHCALHLDQSLPNLHVSDWWTVKDRDCCN